MRLQQVLLNLITNALDAMAETATPVIEISVADAADHLRIVVRDHGPGLAAEMTERAFEPFVSGKKTGEGLGLGLSISHNIITDFGGQITAANHPEGGAVFDVMLRRADNMALAGQ